jgi:hypothetical protein
VIQISDYDKKRGIMGCTEASHWDIKKKNKAKQKNDHEIYVTDWNVVSTYIPNPE